jgi:hypothetical protein
MPAEEGVKKAVFVAFAEELHPIVCGGQQTPRSSRRPPYDASAGSTTLPSAIVHDLRSRGQQGALRRPGLSVLVVESQFEDIGVGDA